MGIGVVMQVKAVACALIYLSYNICQNPIIAIQSNVNPEDLPQTTALVSFAQLFGGVLGIGVCGNVFASELSQYLKKYAPEAPFTLVRDSVEAIYTLPVEQRPGVIHAYVLVNSFLLTAALLLMLNLEFLLGC